MTDTAKLIAKLGPKTCHMPAGERRAAAKLPAGKKNLHKVRRALEIRGGSDSITRVHGSQTQSMDIDAQSPQDIAAALGFIRDPLARELFCHVRWPGYAERDNRETEVLLLRRVMDEGQRRQDEFITAWLRGLLDGSVDAPATERWPMKFDRYPKVVRLCMRHLDGSGLPEVRKVAKAIGISERAYHKSWRRVVEWVHDEFAGMVRKAEGQFKSAAER